METVFSFFTLEGERGEEGRERRRIILRGRIGASIHDIPSVPSREMHMHRRAGRNEKRQAKRKKKNGHETAGTRTDREEGCFTKDRAPGQ